MCTESESEESSNEEAANFRSPTKAKAKARVSSGGAGKQNSQLAVGYRGDLSFVVRGDMIGIFQSQTTGSKKLKFMTSIQGLTSPDGKKAFEPTKVMLHNQDSTMVLKDPRNPYSLFRLDLNTGKVVEEWKVSDAFEVKNFLPKTKFAQMDPEQTLVGTSANGIFRIDPRLSGSKLVDSEFKQYATKADFSTAATTETGRLAVASNKGDLRLYDAIGKNAKTALPALGDPIVGVDVSADGRYIVATTKTYLLFIDTLITEGRYKGSSGFDRSFPATAKPKPVRLALRQEHMAYMDHNVSFTPAKSVHLLEAVDSAADERAQVQSRPERAREDDRHLDRTVHRRVQRPPADPGQGRLHDQEVRSEHRRRQLSLWQRPRHCERHLIPPAKRGGR